MKWPKLDWLAQTLTKKSKLCSSEKMEVFCWFKTDRPRAIGSWNASMFEERMKLTMRPKEQLHAPTTTASIRKAPSFERNQQIEIQWLLQIHPDIRVEVVFSSIIWLDFWPNFSTTEWKQEFSWTTADIRHQIPSPKTLPPKTWSARNTTKKVNMRSPKTMDSLQNTLFQSK